jgi:predicted lipid-binding transport protein (Tim44 family)
MPLSEQEQRLLEEMERGLYHNDADFVATVGGTPLRPSYRSIAIGVLAAVAGIGGLIAGVAVQQLWIGILGFIVMFAGVLIATTPGKSGRQPGGQQQQRRQPMQRNSNRGFMDRMNDRWDRRQDGQ